MLALALDEDRGVDDRHVPLLLVDHVVDPDADGVRHLVVRVPQDLLADELGHEHLVGLVGRHLAREVARSHRQHRRRPTARNPSRLKPSLAESTTTSSNGASACGGGDALLDRLLRRQVRLGQHEHLARAGRGHVRGHPAIAAADGLRGVDHHARDVDVGQAHERAAVELLAERVVRLVQAGRVDEHDLGVLGVDDRAQPVARRLRLVRDDRDLRSHERVDERRLAGVRAADQGDEAAADLARGGLGPVTCCDASWSRKPRTNASGSSSSRVVTCTWSSRPPMITRMSGLNSARNWRHAPHGTVGSSESPTTAIASKNVLPGQHGRHRGAALGADGGAVRRVLDVAALVDLPAGVDRGTHAEVGIRSVGLLLRLAREREQRQGRPS